jgi:anaerobic ribonucleoside-triphosphate reductase activating protein
LGGEPFEPQNQSAILELLRQIKKKFPQKSIWAFSGYLFDKDILAGKLGPWEITREYIGYLDVLVDGPFVEATVSLK